CSSDLAAARSFLDKHDLGRHVHTVVGRVPGRPDLLKPHPHLVRTAMARHGMRPGQCVLVGDSVSDVQAARNAGTRVIAYINKPHKRARLHAAGPDATVASIAELTRSLPTPTWVPARPARGNVLPGEVGRACGDSNTQHRSGDQ